MIDVDFHELAEKELLDSRDYYDDLKFELGKKFILEVENILNRIIHNPLAFPIFFKNYRKALLRKFPYSIIYKSNDNRVFVLAVAHQKRRPKYFVNRFK